MEEAYARLEEVDDEPDSAHPLLIRKEQINSVAPLVGPSAWHPVVLAVGGWGPGFGCRVSALRFVGALWPCFVSRLCFLCMSLKVMDLQSLSIYNVDT